MRHGVHITVYPFLVLYASMITGVWHPLHETNLKETFIVQTEWCKTFFCASTTNRLFVSLLWGRFVKKHAALMSGNVGEAGNTKLLRQRLWYLETRAPAAACFVRWKRHGILRRQIPANQLTLQWLSLTGASTMSFSRPSIGMVGHFFVA